MGTLYGKTGKVVAEDGNTVHVKIIFATSNAHFFHAMKELDMTLKKDYIKAV